MCIRDRLYKGQEGLLTVNYNHKQAFVLNTLQQAKQLYKQHRKTSHINIFVSALISTTYLHAKLAIHRIRYLATVIAEFKYMSCDGTQVILKYPFYPANYEVCLKVEFLTDELSLLHDLQRHTYL